MKPSVVKVVNALLRRFQEAPEAVASENKMRHWLADQGYKQNDIEAAIKYFVPNFLQPKVREEVFPRAMRQFALYEHAKMTPEARSALARLDMHGLVEPREREFLIERLMQMEGDIDLDTLDFVLSTVFCTTRNAESQSTLLSTMEGYGPTLH